MNDTDQIGDRDRLPWLEPYSDKPAAPAAKPATAAPKPPRPDATIAAARPSSTSYVRVPLWLLLAVGALALGIGGYFVGRQAATPDGDVVAGSSVTTPLPQATLPYHSLEELANEAVPAPPSPAELAKSSAPSATPSVAPKTEPVRTTVRPKAASSRASTVRHKVRTTVHRQHGVTVHRTVPRKQVKPRRPRFVGNTVRPRGIGPSGQVIELGRFRNPRTADALWRQAVWRYPYLGRLNKAVTPSAKIPGRQSIYALRLGTGSKNHARILCRNLHSIGYPCAVV